VDDALPDAAARRVRLLDHDATLMVEAGAAAAKTALIAGRIALLLAAGPCPGIVAITFTEAASSELRERIDRFVSDLAEGKHPRPVALACPVGLSADQPRAIEAAAETLDELTSHDHHVLSAGLSRIPRSKRDRSRSAIIDPAAADLA